MSGWLRLALRNSGELALLLTPLPLGECSGVLTSLPLFNGAILVVETEVAGGKPPLDGPAERGASAPAVRVAGALPVAGVVDSLKEGPRDPQSLRRAIAHLGDPRCRLRSDTTDRAPHRVRLSRLTCVEADLG